MLELDVDFSQITDKVIDIGVLALSTADSTIFVIVWLNNPLDGAFGSTGSFAFYLRFNHSFKEFSFLLLRNFICFNLRIEVIFAFRNA